MAGLALVRSCLTGLPEKVFSLFGCFLSYAGPCICEVGAWRMSCDAAPTHAYAGVLPVRVQSQGFRGQQRRAHTNTPVFHGP